MRRLIVSLLLVAVLGVLVAVLGVLAAPAAAIDALLIDAATLQAQRGARDLRIIDMVDEVADYRRGHIPDAVYLEVEQTRVPVPGRGFRLPTADEASRLF